MDEWKIKQINTSILEHQKEEIRKFSIAYASLDEKFHGYLQTLPQNIQIWWEKIDDTALKALQKTYGWEKVSQWASSKGSSTWKLYYKADSPYLGIDGHIAMFMDKYKDGSITTELIQAGNRLIAKATVFTDKGKWVGMAEVPEKDTIDITVATAIRKALTYTGDGRFPIHATSYGDHSMVVKFRKFYEENKEPKK